MKSSSKQKKGCPAGCDPGRVMTSGLIQPAGNDDQPVEVRRGMSIWTSDGQEAGKVAALIVDHDSELAWHILLGRLPEILGYLCVPVDLIKSMEGDALLLGITSLEIENLTPWCSNI